MPSSQHIVGKCEICDEGSRGYHFGVIACRACAAFFRRTIAHQLKYKCRFEGHCLINKSVRCMCRECRFKKCLEVGMKAEAVQLNRDTIGSTISKRQNCIVSKSQSSRTNSVICASPQPSQREIVMAKVNHIFECASLNNDFQQQQSKSIVDEMLQGYHEVLMLRCMVHANATIIPTISITTDAEEREHLIKHNCETFICMIKDEIELTARMIVHFRPFLRIVANERMLLFERFWMHFLKLERAYAVFKQLGDDLNDDRVVLFNNFVVDRQQCLSNLEHLSNMDRSLLQKLFSNSREITKCSIVVPLKRLKPSEQEFIAICGHMLWTAPELHGLSVETHEIARETRSLIFTELHRYYTEEMKLFNYAPRIGEFMALVSAVERSVAQKKEDAILIDLFDVFHLGKSYLGMFR